MATPIRYAIWAAVSTEEQAAPGKVSLEKQQIGCLAACQAHGWVEGAGPYVVPGASRTVYVDLSTAEENIPQLRQMLKAASKRRFDVLVIYDYDRLRELLDPVYRLLSSYKIQIYSVSQPVEIVDPEQYDYYTADTAFIMQSVARITSRTQISDLRRKYKSGMPARVTKRGLPAISIPFGYRKPPGRETDSNAIPEKDPVRAPLVEKFKDLFLAGRSIHQLAQFATGTGIKPPKGNIWYPASIRDMLRNPFYAGYNRWGLSRSFTDLRTGKRKRDRDIDLDQVIVEKGKHEPIWDEATHQLIIEELDRRGNAYRGKKSTQLSRILTCASCGKPLWMQHNGSRTEPDRSIWRCSNRDCGQANIHHSQALAQLTDMLVTEFRKQNDPRAPRQEIPAPSMAALEELKKKRNRLTDIYLDGGIGKPEFMKRAAEIDAQIDAEEEVVTANQSSAAARKAREDLVKSFSGMVGSFGDWLLRSDPQQANSALVMLLEYVRVTGDKITEIKFRE